jgi:hypothetical protein
VGTRAKAEEVEARAFAVAEVASVTTKEQFSEGTGGERPVIELVRQGLTLVHFSAQRKRLLWDRGCI